MGLVPLTMTQKQGFFEKMFPYAKQASKDLDIPVSVILAQWAHESWYGYSDLAKNTGNLAGIKHNKYSIDVGAYGNNSFANYGGSIDKFTQDYVRVMRLGYYNDVRSAGSVNDTVKELSESPFDQDHYGGTGQALLDKIKSFGLAKYDSMVPSPPSADGQKKK